MTVKEVVPINSRKFKVIFEENYSIPLYKTEIRRYNIEAGRELEDSDIDLMKMFQPDVPEIDEYLFWFRLGSSLGFVIMC